MWDNGEGDGTPLQYSCLENPMDGGAWWAAVHGVAEGRTQLRDFTFSFHFHALEKEMATHSNVLAWRIPGTGEPGGLLSMGSHRVGHDWSDLALAMWDKLRKKALLEKLSDSKKNHEVFPPLTSNRETYCLFEIPRLCPRKGTRTTAASYFGGRQHKNGFSRDRKKYCEHQQRRAWVSAV